MFENFEELDLCENVQMVKSKVNIGQTPYDAQRTRIHPSFANTLIRIGDSVDVAFNVTEPEIYPAELYYLMDISYSMREDMETMKKMGGEIAQKAREFNSYLVDNQYKEQYHH